MLDKGVLDKDALDTDVLDKDASGTSALWNAADVFSVRIPHNGPSNNSSKIWRSPRGISANLEAYMHSYTISASAHSGSYIEQKNRCETPFDS